MRPLIFLLTLLFVGCGVKPSWTTGTNEQTWTQFTNEMSGPVETNTRIKLRTYPIGELK